MLGSPPSVGLAGVHSVTFLSEHVFLRRICAQELSEVHGTLCKAHIAKRVFAAPLALAVRCQGACNNLFGCCLFRMNLSPPSFPGSKGNDRSSRSQRALFPDGPRYGMQAVALFLFDFFGLAICYATMNGSSSCSQVKFMKSYLLKSLFHIMNKDLDLWTSEEVLSFVLFFALLVSLHPVSAQKLASDWLTLLIRHCGAVILSRPERLYMVCLPSKLVLRTPPIFLLLSWLPQQDPSRGLCGIMYIVYTIFQGHVRLGLLG